MVLTYILILALLIITIIAIIKYKANSEEGFNTYFKVQNKYTKESDSKFSNTVNKSLIINSELYDELKQVNGALNISDVFAGQNNKKTDYSKFFISDPLPGLESDGKKCSAILEPRLLPKHESTNPKGCGWWYSDNDAYQSVGALGILNDPFEREKLEKDVPGGVWLWDLELAQKKEDIKRCRRIKSCDMADLIPGKCGFCVEQNRGIPIDSKGESIYNEDPDFMCDTIVTKPIKCPRPDPIPSESGQPAKPVVALCDPNPVTGQLTKDCLINLAKGVGFTNSGAIIDILLGDSGGYYDEKGANRKLFLGALNVLQTDASISSPKAYFGFDPCSRAEVLGYYNSVYKTSLNGSTKKVRDAAKFLAVGSADFDTCTDDINAYGPFELSCLERVALEAGCQQDGSDFPKEIKKKPNNAPAYCKRYGRPNEGATIRLYSQNECNSLNGNFHGNGECTKKEGGSYSWDCRELNLLGQDVMSSKEKYDGMKWGDVINYFSSLYSQMHSADKDKVVSATKRCLGIDIALPESASDDTNGMYVYCYKWDYDSNVVDGRPPRSTFFGRFIKNSMIEFNNNGEYTPFGLGTDRIHLRMKTELKLRKNEKTKMWVLTDDGIGIIADDKIVLQKWFDQGPTQYETMEFTLKETENTVIQINYFNNGGGYTFVPRIKQNENFTKIPDTILKLDQPANFPFARWDFYEGKVEDMCNNLASEVIGNIPIGVCDGKKCALFENKNYIQIVNGISNVAFKSVSMMIYIRSDHSGWPRLWEFNNTKLGGNWCEDSIFGCLSPNNSMGLGFYVHKDCNGPSAWSGANTIKVGKWYHIVWALDENQEAYTVYIDQTLAYRNSDPNMAAILKNRIYKNMYIVNSVELFSKDIGVAWFRIFDYTMTSADVKIDAANGWSTNKLFPKSSGTGW